MEGKKESTTARTRIPKAASYMQSQTIPWAINDEKTHVARRGGFSHLNADNYPGLVAMNVRTLRVLTNNGDGAFGPAP